MNFIMHNRSCFFDRTDLSVGGTGEGKDDFVEPAEPGGRGPGGVHRAGPQDVFMRNHGWSIWSATGRFTLACRKDFLSRLCQQRGINR